MAGKTSLSLFGAAIFANAVSHPAAAQNVEDFPDNRERPNILMIVIDDMNNWIGSLGGKAYTPNIDRLASRGVLFSNAYCVVPASNPSRTAMMTGLRPETTWQWTNDGLWREKRPENMEITTLGQLLQKNGYITEAVGKIFHQPRGKDAVPNPYSDPVSWSYQYPVTIGTPGSELYRDRETGKALWHGGTLSGYFGTGCFWGPIPNKTEECGDYAAADTCAKFLERDHDKPFFFALGIFRPHSPQLAPEEYFEKYPIDQIATPQNIDEDLSDIAPEHRENFFTPLVREMIKRGEWEKAIQAYYASMSFADACVGHALDALEKSRYKDNTIVIFWTDHGFQIGEKYRFEKYSLWRLGTNSPLIISYPGMKESGKTCNRAVSMLDLYPTIVEFTGVSGPPHELQGTSLLPLTRNVKAEKMVPAVITYGVNNHSIVRDQWNYIHYDDGSEELYNHLTDPAEFFNLAGDPSCRHILEELREWLPDPVDKTGMPSYVKAVFD